MRSPSHSRTPLSPAGDCPAARIDLSALLTEQQAETSGESGERMSGPKSAELLCSPTSRFQHRQLSLDHVVAPDSMDDCPASRLSSHSHVHHHLRHHHSIYSRNHSYQGNRFPADGGGACKRQSCSCSLLLRHEPCSPGRQFNFRLSSDSPTPQPLTVSPALSVAGDESVDGVVTASSDRIDSLPLDMSFTWFDILALVTSITTFLIDIGTDTVVAAFHLHNGDYWYFSLTVAFIVIPTLIVTGISLRWYVLDAREEGSPPITKCKWLTRVTFLLLQLGPIIRYIDSLIYGIKFRRSSTNRSEQKKYYQYMVYEDTDATMLRLFECFMEAAPQLVLQIYIMVKKTSDGTSEQEHLLFTFVQVAAVFASLISLSWSLVSYQRALRMSLPDKMNMTWPGLIVQFLWRICMVGSRVLVLALFAATFKAYIGLFCLVHWFLMFAWIISMRTSFCDNKCEELGYNAVLAVMFIFCYFNPVDSPTRYRYTTYYLIAFVENVLLMSLFFFHNNSLDNWYRIPAVAVHFTSFFLGLVIMVIYYLHFHPTGAIRIFRDEESDADVVRRRSDARKIGYKKQVSSQVWINQGRVLHPRPAVPNITNVVNAGGDFPLQVPDPVSADKDGESDHVVT